MGDVYANITLSNSVEAVLAKRGLFPSENIRKVEVRALIDTGARTLTITEEIAKQLDLEIREQVDVQLADGSYRKCDYSGPVYIRFENRTACVRAIVIPGTNEVLLGVIPLEEMDVIIDPLAEKLMVHPGRPHCAQMRV
jgi:clan AA aspartic protease